MKKLLAVSIITVLLMGCSKTSDPENLSGKIDMSRPVGYVVVNEAEKDRTVYIMTGQKIESDEETENIEVTE